MLVNEFVQFLGLEMAYFFSIYIFDQAVVFSLVWAIFLGRLAERLQDFFESVKAPSAVG